MKIGLLIQTNLWFCPYVNIYTELLDKWGVEYDLILWNRDNSKSERGILYNGNDPKGKLGKLYGYWRYTHFLKKIIKRKKYDRLIVFSPQIGIFMSKFLKKRYSKRYILDYRDLSIEQYKFLRRPFLRLLDNSFANVISSPGFKKCLPVRDYIISHNFIVSEVEKALSPNAEVYNTISPEILTIGGIRDFESNSAVISALSNDTYCHLKFVGRGDAREPLEAFAKEIGTNNIVFEGFYKKENEPEYIRKSTFINIFYPDKISHATALSNRFYNSLIYRRPMIVTKGQIQGEYAEKYNVGVAVSDPSLLKNQLTNWIKTTDFEQYENNCITLLNEFMRDYETFKNTLYEFVNS